MVSGPCTELFNRRRIATVRLFACAWLAFASACGGEQGGSSGTTGDPATSGGIGGDGMAAASGSGAATDPGSGGTGGTVAAGTTGGAAGASGTSGIGESGGASGAPVAGMGGDSGAGGESSTAGEGGTAGESEIAGASGTAGASGAAATGGMGGMSGASGAGSGGEPARELTLLVTNDDGVGADGIDMMVEALRKLPEVSVVVVAPATNQSGTGASLTSGPVQHEPSTTKSGYPAVAVHGYPADTIVVALEELGIEPDFVVSGTNEGVNAGLVVDLSGTVGAARQAARMGVPAIAVSQEAVLGLPSDYAASVKVAVAWIEAKRSAIEAGTLPTRTIVNINAPTCARGAMVRGTVEVPVAFDLPLLPSNCASSATGPRNDVSALLLGYAAVTPDLSVP